MGHLCNMANFITFSRIIFSIILLFCPTLSPTFYVLYVLAGLTDMIDGAVARKTDTVSVLGSRLDAAADFVLVAVCLIKLIPVIHFPIWIYIWIAVIALVKVINYVFGFVLRKQFVALHTVMNKVTGVLLFVLPLTISFIDLKYSGAIVCAVATFAAIQEGHYIRTGKAGS